MSQVDPAGFVVRRKEYPQLAGYPEACAVVTEELLAKKPQHFPEAYEYVIERMKSTPILSREVDGSFGKLRAHDTRVQLRWLYAGDGREASARLLSAKRGERGEVTHLYHSPELNKAIELATIRRGANGVVLDNPSVQADADGGDEHRWSLICQKFRQALDKNLEPAQREKSAKECYAVLGVDRPIRRGTATLSNIMLQYMAKEGGFEVPLTLPEVDLHMKSITRPVEVFLEEWDKGQYFDRNTTPQAVMKWHKSRTAPQEGQAR